MARLNAPKNAFAGMAAAPKGMGQSARNSRGPVEDAADQKGDQMRPMAGPSGGLSGGVQRPVGQAMRKSPGRDMAGSGHMGGWADKMHPTGRK